MAHPRIVEPGAFIMATQRCSERRFFLRPDRETVQNFKFCLGYCQEKYDIAIHEFVAVSNHYHLAMTDDERRPDFFRDFNSLLARSLNLRWGHAENFWCPTPYHVLKAEDEMSAIERLVYIMNHGVKDGLVRYARDWQGPQSYSSHYGAAETIARPDFFFGEDMPESVQVKITRPDIKRELDPGELRRWLRDTAEDDAKKLVRGFKKERGVFMGMERVLKQPRNSSPRIRAKRRGIVPSFATRDPKRGSARAKIVQNFRAKHRECSKRVEKGERGVEFPYGTYLMRIRFGMEVEARPAWAATPPADRPKERSTHFGQPP